MNNYEENSNTKSKSAIKKVSIGVLSIIVIAIISLGIVWTQQSQDKVNIKGSVSTISAENSNIVIHQTKITQNENGEYQRSEKSYTINWNEDTEFSIEGIEGQNLNAENEIFTPQAFIEVQASEQITSDTYLAQKIRLIERSPIRE